MNLLKQAVELKQAQEATAPKKTLIEMIKSMYRRFKGKRAYQAMILAKREEKALQAKTNAQLADELDARSEELLTESVLCKKADPVKSEQLFEEAVELTTKANVLRFN